MKKILALVLVLCMCLCIFAGCNKTPSEEPDAGKQGEHLISPVLLTSKYGLLKMQ